MMGVTRICLLVVLCGVRSQSVVVPVETGHTIVLNCPGPDDAGVVEYWQVPAGTQIPVPFSEDRYIVNTTSLAILDVEEGDAGSYLCHRRGSTDNKNTAILLAVRERPYWQQHGTSLALAALAAGAFLLGCAVLYLVHQYRYERRYKAVSTERKNEFSGAHTNPALDVEAETHL